MSACKTVHVLVAAVGFLLVAASFLVAGDRPNHLEPIQAYNHLQFLDEYYHLVFSTLVKDYRPSIWMVVEPSFRPEYAMILREVVSEDSTETFFELEYAVATEPIWNYDEHEDGTLEPDPRRNANVERKTARLDQEVARDVIGSWEIVLKQTRYAEKDWGGCDGVTYKFYASPDIFGQTWSPDSGVPKMIVECGELLVRYATSGDSEQNDLLDQISKLSAELRKAVD